MAAPTQFLQPKNNARSALAAAIGSADTSLTITFQAGQTYRVVVSTASIIFSISVLTVHHFNIALVKDAIGPVADMWTETSRPNTSSAWTDLDDQVPMVDLLVDSWPGGGSGGLALVQSGYLA